MPLRRRLVTCWSVPPTARSRDLDFPEAGLPPHGFQATRLRQVASTGLESIQACIRTSLSPLTTGPKRRAGSASPTLQKAIKPVNNTAPAAALPAVHGQRLASRALRAITQED